MNTNYHRRNKSSLCVTRSLFFFSFFLFFSLFRAQIIYSTDVNKVSNTNPIEEENKRINESSKNSNDNRAIEEETAKNVRIIHNTTKKILNLTNKVHEEYEQYTLAYNNKKKEYTTLMHQIQKEYTALTDGIQKVYSTLANDSERTKNQLQKSSILNKKTSSKKIGQVPKSLEEIFKTLKINVNKLKNDMKNRDQIVKGAEEILIKQNEELRSSVDLEAILRGAIQISKKFDQVKNSMLSENLKLKNDLKNSHLTKQKIIKKEQNIVGNLNRIITEQKKEIVRLNKLIQSRQSLNDRIKVLENQLNAEKKEHKNAKDKLLGLNTNINKLNKAQEEYNNVKDEFNKLKNKDRNEFNELKNNLTKKEKEYNDAKIKLNELQQQIDQSKNEYEKDINQHKKSKSELEMNLNKLKAQLKKEKKKYNRVEKYTPLLERIKQKKLINIQNQKLHDLEKARDEVEDKLRKEARNKENLLSEKDKLHSQLVRMQNEIDELKKHQQEKINSQGQNSQLLQQQKEFKDTANQIEHLEKEKDKVQNQFTAVSSELVSKQKEIDDQQNSIKSLQSRITELEKEQAILLAEKDKTIEQLHAKVKSLEQLPQYGDNKDVDTMQGEISTLDDFKEDSQGEDKDDYLQEIEELKKKVKQEKLSGQESTQAHLLKIEDLERKLAIQQNKEKKMNNHLHTIEGLKKEIKSLEEQIENMNVDNHDQVAKDNEQLTSAFSDATRDNDANTEINQDSIDVNNNLEQENVDLSKRNKTSKNAGVRVLTTVTILGVAGSAIKHVQNKRRKMKKNHTATAQVLNNMENI